MLTHVERSSRSSNAFCRAIVCLIFLLPIVPNFVLLRILTQLYLLGVALGTGKHLIRIGVADTQTYVKVSPIPRPDGSIFSY